MNENCCQLLNIIDQTSFAMDDVLLFLDTHPCDQQALSYYQAMARAVNSASGYWSWIQGPWPWEGGC